MKQYNMKKNMFNILTVGVLIDIVFTFISVVYLDGIEINPLCNNFFTFFIVKCIVSIITLTLIWALSNKLCVNKYVWVSCVYFLILWYNIIILKNLYELCINLFV